MERNKRHFRFLFKGRYDRMTIVLLGKSAAGKTTLQELLVKNNYARSVISVTTRPKREKEVDGEDYYFVDDNVFGGLLLNGEFLETTEYRGWHYGTLRSEIKHNGINVAVVNPFGFNQYLKSGVKNLVSFYIDTNDCERYIRQLNRGDDIVEVALRSERDKACFQGIKDQVDFVVDNNSNDPNECYQQIINNLKRKGWI